MYTNHRKDCLNAEDHEVESDLFIVQIFKQVNVQSLNSHVRDTIKGSENFLLLVSRLVTLSKLINISKCQFSHL